MDRLVNTSNYYLIYCDMDGVLVDFDKAFLNFSGYTPQKFDSKYGRAEFNKLLLTTPESYWANMNWLTGGYDVWKFIKKYDPTILSSPVETPACKIGKRKWCASHLGSSVPVILFKDKFKYATQYSILIDDYTNKISAWTAAGGIGILHTSAGSTISQLQKIGL